MEKETSLTQKTLKKYDAVCKSVLSYKIFLAWILKECAREYRDIPVADIAGKYIVGTPEISSVTVNPDVVSIPNASVEDISAIEGKVAYDIRFDALVPYGDGYICLIINVEAQYKMNPGYPLTKRGVYYCSRLISAQYGTVFAKSHYEKIRKVYNIWICPDAPKYRQNTITLYHMKEENLIGEVHEKPENYDLLTMVMICLGDTDENPQTGVLRLLDVLLSKKYGVTDKKRILQDEFSINFTQEMEGEVSVMCNLSEGVYLDGIAKGRAEGRAEGMAKGRAEGMAEGILSSIQNLMKNMNWTATQAMDALNIPSMERSEYLKHLAL